jgi:hypothetical protein
MEAIRCFKELIQEMLSPPVIRSMVCWKIHHLHPFTISLIFPFQVSLIWLNMGFPIWSQVRLRRIFPSAARSRSETRSLTFSKGPPCPMLQSSRRRGTLVWWNESRPWSRKEEINRNPVVVGQFFPGMVWMKFKFLVVLCRFLFQADEIFWQLGHQLLGTILQVVELRAAWQHAETPLVFPIAWQEG